MSLLNVPIGSRAPHEFNVIIEIPRGSTNKYELDPEMGVLKLDRVLYSPLYYPFDYGFIPQTHYVDGDPLDAMVLTSHPLIPGCVVECKAIGVLEMQDEKGPDEKILCVALRDPRYNQRRSLNDLQPHTKRELVHFFEAYKVLEEKSVEVVGYADVGLAYELIEKFRTDR
ncbi:MAG: inorganic diphosphatase [Fimbriimonadaceae bacterium]|jgi:inorganic pyrophosphatase